MTQSNAIPTAPPDALLPHRLPPPIAKDTVTVIAPKDRVVTPCSTVVGLMREACVDAEDFWMGMVSSEPGTASAWHDHGERTTYVLPLKGDFYVELEDGTHVPMIADGSVYVTPPHVKHREVNASGTRAEAFLIRVGPKSRSPQE